MKTTLPETSKSAGDRYEFLIAVLTNVATAIVACMLVAMIDSFIP